MFPTGITPRASIMARQGSIRKAPGTSGSGRSARWCWTAEDGTATLSLRNKFSAGDPVEVVGPDFRPLTFPAPEMEDETGAMLVSPRTPQMIFKMKLPTQVPALSILRRAVELSGR